MSDAKDLNKYPYPSKDYVPFAFNVKKIDEFVNSTDEHTDNRKDRNALTWFGIEEANRRAREALNYKEVDYVAGNKIDGLLQYVIAPDGNAYQIIPSTELPYTLTGDWATDSPNFMLMGDLPLRNELASPSGSELVGIGDKNLNEYLFGMIGWDTPENHGAILGQDNTESFKRLFNSGSKKILLQNDYLISDTIISSLEGREISCSGEVYSETPKLKFFEFTGDFSVIQINIRSNSRTSTDGIHINGAKGCIVRGCRIRNLYYKEQISSAIRADTLYGVVISGNYIENSYVYNGETPEFEGANAVSRAIVIQGLQPAILNSVISDNIIIGSACPKTSAIQILFNDGSPLFLDSKCSIVGNTIYGFNRRGMKIQASGVKIIGNTLESLLPAQNVLQSGSCIELAYSENNSVKGNIVTGMAIRPFSIVGDSSRNCSKTKISGNEFTKIGIDGNAVDIFRCDEIVFSNNDITGGAPCMSIGYLTNSSVRGLTFSGDGAESGTGSYCINHNNTSYTDFSDLRHLGGRRTRLLSVNVSTNQENTYEGLKSNHTDMIAVVSGANSGNVIVKDVTAFRGDAITGNRSSGRFSGFSSFSGSSQVGSLSYADGIPSDSTPNVKYNRGDYVLSLSPSPGTPFGWVCTVSGTPGVWRSLGNVQA